MLEGSGRCLLRLRYFVQHKAFLAVMPICSALMIFPADSILHYMLKRIVKDC